VPCRKTVDPPAELFRFGLVDPGLTTSSPWVQIAVSDVRPYSGLLRNDAAECSICQEIGIRKMQLDS